MCSRMTPPELRGDLAVDPLCLARETRTHRVVDGSTLGATIGPRDGSA
jgi:hypothetical protein